MKTNPRRRPRTQADVDRAYTSGLEDGVQGVLSIVLIALKDLGETDEFIAAFEKKFNRTVEAWLAGDVKGGEIEGALLDEYEIEIDTQ